ncbi:MAG TPA: DUF4097 family beta strand repeat-containing protein [Pseudomonadales bacterium]|nr:DUF4097 family beta strand repeat-containing protein [Pseudomonadales bacterium]
MRTIRLVILLASCIATANAFANCNFSHPVNFQTAAGDFKQVRINALAGGLDIVGTNTDTIAFTGKACADDKDLIDRITLRVDKHNGILELTAVIPYHDRDFWSHNATLDIKLTLPANLPIDVKDSSGDMWIKNASVTNIEDSSGDIHVSNGHASLKIRDSSGGIDVSHMDHDLVIKDSSGDIDVEDIAGSVTIPRDSSGDINISRVGGGVRIDSDGAGDIVIRHVKGKVAVGSDGSGGIRIDDVASNVSIGNDGSGSVRVDHVKGDFNLDAKGSGSVRVMDISGKVSTPP